MKTCTDMSAHIWQLADCGLYTRIDYDKAITAFHERAVWPADGWHLRLLAEGWQQVACMRGQ